MMRLSQAAQALGVPFAGRDVEFNAVSTDSRAVRHGDLFVALRGERFDGHGFVAQAAAAGASAAMVEQGREPEAGSRDPALQLPLIVVADTLLALGKLAQYWRRQFDIPLVALTGSNGKTTVKEMLAAILREAVNTGPRVANPESLVLATRGNLNNHIGVPLMLLELRREHRYAVIEMGMNHAGEISYITRLAEPDVALITNAGLAHIEFLGSTEAIARAKGEIFEGLKAGGVAVINADERYAPLWRELAAGRRQLEFGIEAGAAVSASYRLRGLDSEIILKTPRGETRAVVPAPGVHNVRNALAASAAASALQVPLAAVAAGLARFPGVKGRLQRKTCLHGATLIDDSYNANPDSARAAIAVLAQMPGTRLLVLGDMGELGPQAAALHAEVGAFARASGIDRLLTLGEFSAQAAQAFGAGARHFPRIEELLAEIENALAPGVTVLVKGSRFMQMERVVRSFEVKSEECPSRATGGCECS
ncbi:MAG: UDP-N-acetylmuramoyl-tripeptide--D-alanyl-D-alanine ligase [Betaproteobacteria bacterium]|nr:UDP-N-acetylmuramoyl-tripeptide--D-alanyl-D-alanine ligase [Betaproteobacteria bacterium]